MNDSRIMIYLGLLVVIASVSLVVFRRCSLGTAKRIGMAMLAVALLVVWQVQNGHTGPGAVVLAVFAAFVLGAGVWFLWRFENRPPDE